MSIRLICSDIDGTLLQYGKKELESEIFEQIRELHRRGILFCPASGRQYTSLRKQPRLPCAVCCTVVAKTGCASITVLRQNANALYIFFVSYTSFTFLMILFYSFLS